VLVPSTRDAHLDLVFPQPAVDVVDFETLPGQVAPQPAPPPPRTQPSCAVPHPADARHRAPGGRVTQRSPSYLSYLSGGGCREPCHAALQRHGGGRVHARRAQAPVRRRARRGHPRRRRPHGATSRTSARAGVLLPTVPTTTGGCAGHVTGAAGGRGGLHTTCTGGIGWGDTSGETGEASAGGWQALCGVQATSRGQEQACTMVGLAEARWPETTPPAAPR
jgi:hypothetical protein